MSIQNNDKSLIKQLLHSYHPLYITHNNYKYTIYNSTFNNTLYINITPLCKQFNITTHRFLRRKDTQNKINLETGIEYIHWKNPGFDPFEPDQPTLKKIEKLSLSFGIFYNFN